MVEERGTGQLAWPAVHHTETLGLPAPERCGSPRLDCEPETPTARDSSATRRRMSISTGTCNFPLRRLVL